MRKFASTQHPYSYTDDGMMNTLLLPSPPIQARLIFNIITLSDIIHAVLMYTALINHMEILICKYAQATMIGEEEQLSCRNLNSI